MARAERLESLRTKHAALDGQLSEEAQRPNPSYEVLARLKREKLRLKDEITRLNGNGA